MFLNAFSRVYNKDADYNAFIKRVWAVAKVAFLMYHDALAASTSAAERADLLDAASVAASLAFAGFGPQVPPQVESVESASAPAATSAVGLIHLSQCLSDPIVR